MTKTKTKKQSSYVSSLAARSGMRLESIQYTTLDLFCSNNFLVFVFCYRPCRRSSSICDRAWEFYQDKSASKKKFEYEKAIF